MAINLLNGQMLNSTLERDGINLAIVNLGNSAPTLYVDVGNTFIGINTDTPTQALTVGGNAIANNLFSTNNVSVAGNVLGGNLSVGGNVVSVAVSASGNINGANLLGTFVGAGNISVSGNITTGNITVNQTGVLNLANLSITNTTINSISAGTLVAIGGTDGLVLPVGNTTQRPVSPLTGTTRFNTILNDVETYNGAGWVSGSGNLGSITDQQITPDGTSTTYTLTQSATATSIIVSINGVVQLPNVAYTVSGTSLTFSFAPLKTDIIDVRFVTYFNTVSALINDSGNTYVTVSDTPNINFEVAGTAAATINAAGVFQVQGQSLQLPSYDVTQATSIVSPNAGEVIYVTNGNAGAPSLAVYDGISWKRVALGNTISAT